MALRALVVIAALLCGCAHAPPSPAPDAGLPYAYDVSDWRILHVHEVAR